MKTLSRILLIVLSLALLAAVCAMHAGMTQINVGHDTHYRIKWPWLHEVRETAIFGVLVWCLLFLRREPTFARIGLAAVILAFAIMNLPAALAKELPGLPPVWH